MVESYSIAILITGIFLIGVSSYKLKKQTISQGTFTIWFIAGVAAIIIAIVPPALSTIQQILGTELSISTLFGISVIPLILLVFYLHQKVDFLNQRITKLIAELAANRFYKPKEKED